MSVKSCSFSNEKSSSNRIVFDCRFHGLFMSALLTRFPMSLKKEISNGRQPG